MIRLSKIDGIGESEEGVRKKIRSLFRKEDTIIFRVVVLVVIAREGEGNRYMKRATYLRFFEI